MMQINPITLKRMNNGAHILFINNVLILAEADATVSQRAEKQVANLRAAVEQEEADLKISMKSFYTDVIAAADNERKSFYMTYKKAVRSFLRLTAKDKARAAKVLHQQVKDYAIDTRMQLDRKSGLFINFIADLEEKHAETVALLSLTPFVEGMKAANERVLVATERRMEERISHQPGALRATRKLSDEAYRALVAWVNACALLEGEAEYLPFMERVNAEIVHYKRKVLGQKAAAFVPAEETSAEAISPDRLPAEAEENAGEGAEE